MLGEATEKLREPKRVRTRGTANKLQSEIPVHPSFINDSTV